MTAIAVDTLRSACPSRPGVVGGGAGRKEINWLYLEQPGRPAAPAATWPPGQQPPDNWIGAPLDGRATVAG